MPALLQWIGWIACVVYATIPSYWLAIHPWAEYWRARSRSPYRLLLPFWFSMWIAVAVLTVRWRGVSFYSTPWSWLPAVLLFILGLSIYVLAGRNFSGQQLGGLPELLPNSQEQRLVISGIRARVRHPIYLGHLCEMLAWSVGTGLAVCYALTAFAVVTGAVMIRMEDDELEKRFGAEYIAYRRRVPAVLPGMSHDAR
jgi:protein-S-isoprenylcysteine O-methyltransferase Ste14